MVERTDPGSSGSAKAKWRGKGRAAPSPTRGWQQTSAARTSAKTSRGGPGRWFKVWGLLTLALGLLATLVVYLLFAPAQTPLVAIVATGYDWHLPPNAWAQEDLDGVAQLAGKTLNLRDLSAAWRPGSPGMPVLDAELKALAHDSSQHNAVILYVSMHAALDGSGAPCLVPPSASPWDTRTWLQVSELLSRIKAQNLPEGMHKLLVLDCQRAAVNWSLGSLYNGFVQRLPGVIEAAGIPNLVVLTAAGAGQAAWASPTLSGSAFGHYFQAGLAGEADEDQGNSDHWVSLYELHNYLLRNVDTWAREHRGQCQQPQLIPAKSADFHVAWALGARARRGLRSQAATGSPQLLVVTEQATADLWKKHDELRNRQVVHYEPVPWRDFEQKLLWLECLAMSGRAYESAIAATSAELLVQAEELEQGASGAAAPPIKVHSLAAAVYFGQLSQANAAKQRAPIDRYLAAPSATNLSTAIALTTPPRGLVPLAERHFLQLIKRHAPPDAAGGELPGQALAVEELALRARLPADERTQYFLRASGANWEKLRRDAMDHLLISGDDTLGKCRADLAAARKGYEQILDTAGRLAQAFAFRDRAWAELPYLAAWLARPATLGESTLEADRQVNELLLPLIADLRRLTEALAVPGTDPRGGSFAAALDQFQQTQGRLEQLEQLFDGTCQQLLARSQPTPQAWQQVEAVLSVPSIPNRTREQLRRLKALWDGQLPASSADQKSSSDGADENGQTQAANALKRVATIWNLHPALALIGQAASVENTDELRAAKSGATSSAVPDDLLLRLIAQGDMLRTHLGMIPSRVQQLLKPEETGSATSTEPRDALPAFPRASTEADQLTRIGLGLGCPAPREDPAERLRQEDLQQLLLALAQTSLDDFWGPATEREAPFFAVAAADYLDSARVLGDLRPDAKEQVERLRPMIELRSRAAREGLRPAVADILLIEKADEAEAVVDIQPGPREAARGLPPGDAAVFIRDARGRLPGTDGSLELGPAWDKSPRTEPLHYTLRSEQLVGRGPILQAVALLRGNEFVAPFLLRPPSGVKIELNPYRYDAPRLTLNGPERKRASIMFVLDCSASMSKPTEVESPDSSQTLPRMEVAKNALIRMLDQLAEDGSARVGVMFFGHRVGWNTKQPSQLLIQPDYPGKIPEDLLPSEDVELVLPLGRFDPVVAGGVAERLKSIKPWGETPLYLALEEALGDFAKEPAGTEKSIVVIADGINYQYNSPQPKTRAEVVAAEGDQKIPIHIVGFQIAPEEAVEARSEFSALAVETGGSYVPATDATSLLRSLESLLGSSSYTVTTTAGKEVASATMGTPVTLSLPGGRPDSFNVNQDTASTQVELFGGEALELVLMPGNRAIESVRYDKGAPQFLPLVRGADFRPTDFILGVHHTVSDGAGFRFPVSWQRKDRGFVARPGDSWVEVTPLGAGGQRSQVQYIFYDSNWEPGKPVPLLDLLAADWPRGAGQAEVWAWFKAQKTKPAKTITWQQVAELKPGAESTVPGVPGVSYQVRTRRGPAPGQWQVGVVERHSDQSPGLGAIKVETFPEATRISHRFDPENQLVTHIFAFETIDDSTLQSGEIRFTVGAEIKADAWRTEQKALVNVTPAGDLIRLAPPANAP